MLRHGNQFARSERDLLWPIAEEGASINPYVGLENPANAPW